MTTSSYLPPHLTSEQRAAAHHRRPGSGQVLAWRVVHRVRSGQVAMDTVIAEIQGL